MMHMQIREGIPFFGTLRSEDVRDHAAGLDPECTRALEKSIPITRKQPLTGASYCTLCELVITGHAYLALDCQG